MASILKDEPDWTILQRNIPNQILTLLHRCFKKDLSDRLQHIGDGRLDIKEAIDNPITAVAFQSPQKKSQSFWRRFLPWIVASLMGIIAFISLWNILTREAPKEKLPIRYVVNPPEGEQLNVHTNLAGIAISPDGRNLVYAVGFSELYLRSMNSLESTFLSSGGLPFFSPDGKWVGCTIGGRLKKISLDGGSPQDICDVDSFAWGGSWGTDDTIIFSDSGILWRVSASGGIRERLIDNSATDQEENKVSYCFPRHLPGGKAILFTILMSAEDMSIAFLDLETKEQKILIDKGTGANYVQSGHILYSRGNDLFARKFDISNYKVVGHSFPVVHDVTPPLWYGQVLYSVSSEGTLVYIPAASLASTRLVWIDREGKVDRLPLPPANYGDPRVSPNGKQILFTRLDERNKIWIYDLEREYLRPLMDEKGEEWVPAWAPDNQKIAFYSNRIDQPPAMLLKSVDSDKPPEILIETSGYPCPHSFSPDGKMIAFRLSGERTDYDIWLLQLDGSRKPIPFLQSQAYESWPKFSPDGEWIVYQSEESGQMEVYIRPIKTGNGKSRQVSNNGGIYPLWSPDGAEIFYANEDKIMSVSFQGEPEVSLGMPKILFEWPTLVGDDFTYGHDIAPDGQRFLMLESGNPQTITVVLNWLEELKSKIKE
jgi:WD40 repeat protein